MQQNELENAYLSHLLIAAEARDFSAPFRTFFDNWFAFHVGGPFLNRSSRPHWFNNPCPNRHGNALRRAHFVSAAAARTLSQLTRDRLVKDHAIPVAILRGMLFEAQPRNHNDVRDFLLRYYRIGIITEAEHTALSAAGLKSRMPDDWQSDASLFRRYEAVGIVAQDVSSINGRRDRANEVTPRTLRQISKARFLNSTSRSSDQGIAQ